MCAVSVHICEHAHRDQKLVSGVSFSIAPYFSFEKTSLIDPVT